MPPKGDDFTPEIVLSEVSSKMDKAVEAFKRDLTQLRTGRATPALVENIEVNYYGSMTPLKQIASISAPDARAIMIQPYDATSMREIEKSLMTSEMGFNPSNDGATITVPIPQLTQERRQEMVKLLKGKVGDPIKIVVLTPSTEESREVSVNRALVQVESTLGYKRNTDNDAWDYFVDSDSKIGYVQVTSFGILVVLSALA